MECGQQYATQAESADMLTKHSEKSPTKKRKMFSLIKAIIVSPLVSYYPITNPCTEARMHNSVRI